MILRMLLAITEVGSFIRFLEDVETSKTQHVTNPPPISLLAQIIIILFAPIAKLMTQNKTEPMTQEIT